ncbi:MAG TPA: DNA cytosine methyltransferase [Conexibacter sp.]|nr:DNA cytosine methyltransferase [Conexibacter sp.]
MSDAVDTAEDATVRQTCPFVAVDLFCGAGGLTVGLRQAGFKVLGAVEIAGLAGDAYELNHPEVRLWRGDIRAVDPGEMMAVLGIAPGELDLLAGCPPCQGFSTMRTHRKSASVTDPRNDLVGEFARFADAMRPRALMMENVPGLASDERLDIMLARLERTGYKLSHRVLDAGDYGVPQRRRRLVVLGALSGLVPFAPAASRRSTVREAIGSLPPAGSSGDALHDHGEQRSAAVNTIIRDIPHDGGGRRSLGKNRQLACHRRNQGWYDVYGRMAWDEPAPTITSGCINPSKGRFLHPVQDRAITLREAALLQTFPADYDFPLDKGKYRVADLIGNALPPAFVASQAQMVAARLVSADTELVGTSDSGSRKAGRGARPR